MKPFEQRAFTYAGNTQVIEQFYGRGSKETRIVQRNERSASPVIRVHTRPARFNQNEEWMIDCGGDS